MLLTGPPENIHFRYLLLRKAQIMNAPHLFAKNSPLLLLATVLQHPRTVETFLKRAGFVFDQPIGVLVTTLLQELETKDGGAGFATVFAELQQEIEGR